MRSTTGDRSVGQPDFSAIGPWGAPPKDREGYIDWQVRSFRVVGSPGFESIAALATGDRTARLRSLQVPALVLHGAAVEVAEVLRQHYRLALGTCSGSASR